MKGLLLMLTALTGAAALYAAPAGSSDLVTERYYARETWSSFADLGPANPGRRGPADVVVSRLRLTTPDGVKAGLAHGYAVGLRRPYVFSHWTAFLATGTLTLEGVSADSPAAGPQDLTIVGGSGEYRDAHGTVTASDAGTRGTLVVLRYAR